MRLSLYTIDEGETVDVATDRTIRMMAAFAADAGRDPEVQSCALRAAAFAPEQSLRGLAFGVWMWLRHCIRFRSDDGTMMTLGVGQHHDLVIDPRVLVRMRDPAEDCDGFVTMGAALCRLLSLPFFFAAAATEAADPLRWSHTWLVVGGLDIDASHGLYPGWGVPAERRYRFGLWDPQGARVY